MILESYKQHELQMNQLHDEIKQLHDEIKELKQRHDDQHREVMDNLNARPSNAALPTHTKKADAQT
jgi:hypothetical protein